MGSIVDCAGDGRLPDNDAEVVLLPPQASKRDADRGAGGRCFATQRDVGGGQARAAASRLPYL
jgi:hypothetical protein